MAVITSVERIASGGYVLLGSPSEHDNLTNQTIMAYCKPGTIANNSVQYLFAKTPSGEGPRLMVGKDGDGKAYFSFGAASATSFQPSRACIPSAISTGSWCNLCATWDGSITATNIKLFLGGSEVSTYGATTNGTGSIVSDAANNITLFNRTSDYARTFIGDCAYIARWNRILSATEITEAHTNGPGSVPSGLIFLWANQQDYSSLGLTPSARSTFAAGDIPPNTALGIADADTTAPTLSSPTSSATGETSGSGGVTTNEGNGTLYAVATTSATAPTKAQVKAGQDHTGAAAVWSDDQSVTSTGEKTFSISGLTHSTAYYVHFMHEDAAENQSDVSSSASFTTDAVDETAPTLTSATATVTGNTTATGSVTTNEGNGTLYYLVNTSSTATASAVKAGSSKSVTGTGAQSVSLTGLTAETSYYLHFLHRDASGNDSSVVSTAQFTTLAEPVALQLVTSGDSFNIHPTSSSVADAATETPTVTIVPRRQRIIDSDGDNTLWRNFYGKITGAYGKRPLFKLQFANYFFDPITTSWRPWYSYDNVTWNRFPAPTLNGSYYEFQLASAFTGDNVWIGFQPGYPMSRVAALIAELEDSHPDKVHQLPSANSSHVIDNLTAQTDELGNTVPSQPFYGYGIWDDDFPTQEPRRAWALTCGVHPGEHVADYVFEGFIRFLVSDDAKAVALRNNYQFLIYPNINPMGRYGGHIRGQWDTAAPYKNANRDFGTDGNAFQCENSQTLRDALLLDLDGRELAGSLDFHGQQWNPSGKPAATWFAAETADATLKAAFEDRMQAYDAAYSMGEFVTPASAVASFMQSAHGSLHSYTPEAYEQHPATSGVDEWRDAGVDFAKSVADSLSDMVWDGLIPAVDTTIQLAFDDAAPCKLQAFLATSNLTMSDADLKALLDGV